MTTERKLPMTVVPRMSKMTGMRIAQTRGRKRECRMWSSSTKGWRRGVLVRCFGGKCGEEGEGECYHE
jgi:hypothetical protein